MKKQMLVFTLSILFAMPTLFGQTGEELLAAVKTGKIDEVKAVLTKENIDYQNPKLKESALIAATYKNYSDIVQLLIDKDANLNLQNIDGNTALMLASLYGYKDIAKLLIDAGAKLNIQSPKHKGTALHIAIGTKHLDIARLLIDAGADKNIPNYFNKTAQDYLDQHHQMMLPHIKTINN